MTQSRKKSFLFILLMLLSIMLYFGCSSMTTKDKAKSCKKYFPETSNSTISNNIWIGNTDKKSDSAIQNHIIIGIKSITKGEIYDKERIIIRMKLISTSIRGGLFKQDKNTIALIQGKAISSKYAPTFRCRNGDGDLTGFDKNDYTYYSGLIPLYVDKQTFETHIIASDKLSKNDKAILNDAYEFGSPPDIITKHRFEREMMEQLSEEDKAFLSKSYSKNDKQANHYKLNRDTDKELLLNLFSEIIINYSFRDYIEEYQYYDYRNYYILKYDDVNYNNGNDDYDKGLDEQYYLRLLDIFYMVGYVPSLDWSLYFDTFTIRPETGEEIAFDLSEPFSLIEDCSAGCYEFADIMLN